MSLSSAHKLVDYRCLYNSETKMTHMFFKRTLFFVNWSRLWIIILITLAIFACQCIARYVRSVPTGIWERAFNNDIQTIFYLLPLGPNPIHTLYLGLEQVSLSREDCAAISINLFVLLLLHKSNSLLAVIDKFFRLWNGAISTSLQMCKFAM
jgi:hypothetical protein